MTDERLITDVRSSEQRLKDFDQYWRFNLWASRGMAVFSAVLLAAMGSLNLSRDHVLTKEEMGTLYSMAYLTLSVPATAAGYLNLYIHRNDRKKFEGDLENLQK